MIADYGGAGGTVVMTVSVGFIQDADSITGAPTFQTATDTTTPSVFTWTKRLITGITMPANCAAGNLLRIKLARTGGTNAGGSITLVNMRLRYQSTY